MHNFKHLNSLAGVAFVALITMHATSAPAVISVMNYGLSLSHDKILKDLEKIYPNTDDNSIEKIYEYLAHHETPYLKIASIDENICSKIECYNLSSKEINALSELILEQTRANSINLIGWISALGTGISAITAIIALCISIKTARRNQNQIARLNTLEEHQQPRSR